MPVEKKACPHCSKEVLPMHWGRHIAKCEKEAAKVEAETTTTKEAKVATEIKKSQPKAAVADNSVAPETLEKMSPEIRDLYELAEKKQKEFEVAPNAFVTDRSYDEHMELRKVYAPETIDKVIGRNERTGAPIFEKAPFHAYIEDKNELRLAANRGYKVKVDPSGQPVTTASGDVLMTCTREMSDRIQAARVGQAASRQKEAEQRAAVDETFGEGVDASGVKIEESQSTKVVWEGK